MFDENDKYNYGLKLEDTKIPPREKMTWGEIREWTVGIILTILLFSYMFGGILKFLFAHTNGMDQ